MNANQMQQAGIDEEQIHAVLSEQGKAGAQSTLKKYGAEHYRKAGLRGGASVREQRGSEWFRELARKRVEKHGR